MKLTNFTFFIVNFVKTDQSIALSAAFLITIPQFNLIKYDFRFYFQRVEVQLLQKQA